MKRRAAAWCAALGGLCALAQPVAGAQNDSDPVRAGWHFHLDPPPPPAPVPAPQVAPSAPAPAASSRVPELVAFEQLKKRVEELRNIAIMNPTEQNVRAFMDLEHLVVQKSTLFSEMTQRVSFSAPELDPRMRGRPLNAMALRVYDKVRAEERSARLKALGKDHVMLFFFRSDCKYCHAFAPTVAAFAAKHGVRIMPISLDGPGLPDFPSPHPNRGIAATLNVTQVPALFLAKPSTNTVIAVGYGVMSADGLDERVGTVSDPKQDPNLKLSEFELKH